MIIRLLIAAAILYTIYFCKQDSPDARSLLPTALILAIVTNILLLVWIIIYIYKIDHRNSVTVHRQMNKLSNSRCNGGPEDDQPDYNEERNKDRGYTEQDKTAYVLLHCLVPLISACVLFYYYLVIKDWVRRHRNQRETFFEE